MSQELDKVSITSPFDLHTQTAAEVFGVASHQVTPEMRQYAKRMNYGALYGQNAEKTIELLTAKTHSKKPKCPRCLNKKPFKFSCGYCGGQGRV